MGWAVCDGFWNSHFLREVLSEKGNHEMNFHNSFLNNSNDFWDLIVRVWSDLVAPVDFEIIAWFGFAWMPDPAGGQDGHLNHACVLLLLTTLLILRWQVGFSNKQPGWFFISMQAVPLRDRSRSVSFSNWHSALLGRGKGQTHMTTLIILRPPACWAWKWAWKQLGHLKKKRTNNLDDWWFEYKFPCGVDLWEREKKGISFFNTGPPRQGGMIFFSSDRLEPPASWFGKKVAKKGYRGDQLKKKVVPLRERGSILWRWALLSRGECQTHMIILIF